MAPTAAVILFLAFTIAVSRVDSAENYYAYAIVEACGGCSLGRLPDIKSFVYEDLQDYENIVFHDVQLLGAPPELVLFDHNDEEIERLPLSKLTREECNALLVAKGFKRVSKTTDEL